MIEPYNILSDIRKYFREECLEPDANIFDVDIVQVPREILNKCWEARTGKPGEGADYQIAGFYTHGSHDISPMIYFLETKIDHLLHEIGHHVLSLLTLEIIQKINRHWGNNVMNNPNKQLRYHLNFNESEMFADGFVLWFTKPRFLESRDFELYNLISSLFTTKLKIK